MANVKFYSGGGSRPLGGQIDEIPYITAKPGQLNTVASTRYGFAAKMVEALMDKREADMKRDDRAQYMAAATTKGFDPSKMAPMEEESPYVGMQREDMARALRTPQPSNLGGLEEAGDVSRFFRPEGGTESLFGANPSIDPAMQAALLGDVGTRAEDEAAYLANQKAAHIGPREAMRNLTPRTEYGKNLQSEYELGEMERDRALQEAEVERQITADLLVGKQAHELAVKRTAPPKAGEKPGTPYEVNGRLVQDFIDQDGNWATRDVGAAAPQTYSSRKASALQLTDRMTELRAQIAAIPDKNSPERKVLEKELDDLLFNAARDPEALGKVARSKAYGGEVGKTQEEREENMRDIRAGIQTKQDRLPILQKNVDKMKELSGRFWTSGSRGKFAGMFPESAQYELDERKKNIASAVGLQELIAVKAQGATFGSLTENEMELLISSVGNLNTLLKPKVLGETLDNIIRLYAKGLATSKRDFTEVYPDVETPWGPPKAATQQALPPGVRSVQVVGE